MFDHIIGNEKVKKYLTQNAVKGTTANSLLFTGPEGVGKTLFAHAFAKLLICQDSSNHRHRQKIETYNHPDLHIYRPEGKSGMHSIASMREFSEEVYLAPFEARWKIFIIYEADRMLTYSANALLKTFEEPAEDAIIILLSSVAGALLPTVLSRCRTVRFHLLSDEEVARYLISRHGKNEEAAKHLAARAQGSIGKALRLMQEGCNPLRTALLEFLAKTGAYGYKSLSEIAGSLAQQIEQAKDRVEEEVRCSIFHGSGENFSAAQKQSLEKEVEGVVSLLGIQEISVLFETVFSWYRDMHLLHLNGNRSYLLNPDYFEQCSQALEQGKMLPLEKVEEVLAEARLAVERSTSFPICLEGLFLKLLH